MLSLLAKVIPLDLAAVISPVLFGLAILSLTDKENRNKKISAFLIGALIVGIGITLVGFTLGNLTPDAVENDLPTTIVDLFLGVLFLIYGIKVLISKSKKPRHFNIRSGNIFLKWFLAGIVLGILNDSFFLIFASAKEVGSSSIASYGKLIFLIINVFFFTLPITFPLIVYLAFPNIRDKVLAKINDFIVKYSKYIIFALFIVFGIIFLIRGLKYFI